MYGEVRSRGVVPVDLRDEQSAPPFARDQRGQRPGDRARALRAVRFRFGQKRQQVSLGAPDPRNEASIRQHDLRAGDALRPGALRFGPRERRPVRVGRIGGRQHEGLRFFRRLRERPHAGSAQGPHLRPERHCDDAEPYPSERKALPLLR